MKKIFAIIALMGVFTFGMTQTASAQDESAYVRHVAEKLAEIYDTDFDEIVHQTTKNTLKVFKKVTFFDKN